MYGLSDAHFIKEETYPIYLETRYIPIPLQNTLSTRLSNLTSSEPYKYLSYEPYIIRTSALSENIPRLFCVSHRLHLHFLALFSFAGPRLEISSSRAPLWVPRLSSNDRMIECVWRGDAKLLSFHHSHCFAFISLTSIIKREKRNTFGKKVFGAHSGNRPQGYQGY